MIKVYFSLCNTEENGTSIIPNLLHVKRRISMILSETFKKKKETGKDRLG